MAETKYKLTLTIGYNGTHEVEITIDEMEYTEEVWWNELTEDEREEVLLEEWKDWSNGYIDGGWEIIKEG